MNNKKYENFDELISSEYFTKDPIVSEDYYYTIEPLDIEITINNTKILIQDITTISVDDFDGCGDDLWYYFTSNEDYETEIKTKDTEQITWTIINVPLTSRKDALEHQIYVELSNDLFLASNLQSFRIAIQKFHEKLKKGEIKSGH